MDLVTVLMKRDNLPRNEAEAEIEEMKERVADGEDPEEVLHDCGLEPDYVLDLLD